MHSRVGGRIGVPDGENMPFMKPFFQCKQHVTGFFKVESDIFSDYTFASHTSQNVFLLNTYIRREIMRLEPLVPPGAYQNVTLRS